MTHKKSSIKECNICGSSFDAGRDKTNRVRRKVTCPQPECQRKARAQGAIKLRKPKRICAVCGNECAERRSPTCSRACGMQLRSFLHDLNGTSSQGVCVYGPVTRQDAQYMLDILARKGYSESEKEDNQGFKYRIETLPSEEIRIFYYDRLPHPDSDDGRVCASEEFQRFCHDLEQKAEKEGSYFTPFQVLQTGSEDWEASVN